MWNHLLEGIILVLILVLAYQLVGLFLDIRKAKMHEKSNASVSQMFTNVDGRKW